MSKRPQANRRYNTKKYKAHASGITSVTFDEFDKTVVVTRVDPATGEVVRTVEQAKRPRRKRGPT